MEISDTYRPGLTCMLRSGGPLMTIESVDETGMLQVCFHQSDGKFVKEDVDPITVYVIEPVQVFRDSE